MSKRKKVTTKTRQRAEKPNRPAVRPVSKRKPVKRVETRDVVYVGTADVATRFGAVTGNKYQFIRDRLGVQIATTVAEEDYSALVAERGRGCAARDPEALFMSKIQWDLEVQMAKEGNR